MVKEHHFLEHTADLGLLARGGTLAELFEALAEGLARVVGPADGLEARDRRVVELEAEDLEALAVDYLGEVLRIIQGDHFLVSSARVIDIDERHVRAELVGELYDPSRHEIATEVKAVTYHGLLVAPEDAGWTGRVILDL